MCCKKIRLFLRTLQRDRYLRWALLLLALLLFCLPLARAFQNWEHIPSPSTNEALSTALPHPTDEEKTLVAAAGQIFEARAGSKNWKKLSSSRTNLEILRLYHFPQYPEQVFVLADRGLFQFHVKNPEPWQTLRNARHGEIFTAFTISPQNPHRWFLGSTFHLYESFDAGKIWRISGALYEDPICFLKFSGTKLYAASDKTLYVSSDLSYFKKSLSLITAEEGVPLNQTSELEEELDMASCPFYDIVKSPLSPKTWAATHRGVYQSKAGGWEKLPQSGLASLDVRHLVVSSSGQELFAGTPEGTYAFRAEENRWQTLYRSTGGETIKGLLLDNAQKKLYGITTHDLVSIPLLPDNIRLPTALNPENKMLFQQLIRLEPSARDVHQAVIRYANLKNSKTKRWQAESRLRAFIPSFSFGKDLSRGNNIDLDRGSTNERDLFIEGPEDISRGWDMTVSWDLGDFIFSSNQTSIDSREKLMVELRHDLTQEATRLYYERRRLQTEAALTPAPTPIDHLHRLTQIEELTALLDALTNGLMNERLEMIDEEYPQLRRLWDEPLALIE